jgi:hypothetical protein
MKRLQIAIMTTNEIAIKTPLQAFTPTRLCNSMQMRMVTIITSAYSGGELKFNDLKEISLGTSNILYEEEKEVIMRRKKTKLMIHLTYLKTLNLIKRESY